MTRPEREARTALAEARKEVDVIGSFLLCETIDDIKKALHKVLDAQEKAVDFCSAIEI